MYIAEKNTRESFICLKESVNSVLLKENKRYSYSKIKNTSLKCNEVYRHETPKRLIFSCHIQIRCMHLIATIEN